MTDLVMGANAPLTASQFSLEVALPTGTEIDITALQLAANGKVRGDGDMCFFNQPQIGNGALSLTSQPGRATFQVNLDKVEAEIEKIVITATVDAGKSFGALSDLAITLSSGTSIKVETAGRQEAALILCELYRRNGQWKIRNVSQGFNGGLQKLAEHFGVEIAAPEPAPPPPPAPAPAPKSTPKPTPAPSVSLSKVSLTKQESTVSLTKSDGRFGKIRVNLNWNQKAKSSGGLFGMGKRGIDLDLGAFIETRDGNRTVVQALGKMFGDYGNFPYVRLLADDRTGASTDGEWLEINGDAWGDIRKVLIYAFIYEGVADWRETDGVIRMMVPDQPEVEVKMNEYGSKDGMCAVALLENDGGKIKVNREVSFFKGHRYMDERYGWGMNWVAGRK